MKLLENIRDWKNSTFHDWQWDLLVGGVCGIVSVIVMIVADAILFRLGYDVNLWWLILLLPFLVTVVNQLYNKLFEPKDFALRMAIPIIIFIIQCFI